MEKYNCWVFLLSEQCFSPLYPKKCQALLVLSCCYTRLHIFGAEILDFKILDAYTETYFLVGITVVAYETGLGGAVWRANYEAAVALVKRIVLTLSLHHLVLNLEQNVRSLVCLFECC